MSRRIRRTPLSLVSLEDRSVPSAAVPADYAADSILVRLKPDAPRGLTAVAPGANLDRPLPLVDGLWTVRLGGGLGVPAALAAARANPFVLYAEPNYTLRLAQTPNDPSYGSLWGMTKIAMPAAWDVRTDGGGVLVAVIDTGADYNHPDLRANLWQNAGEVAGDGVDNDRNGFIDDVRGWDFINGDNDPMDDHSHGTHVSGTIGAVGNNGAGVAGVNWQARIMPLKTFDARGYGDTATSIAALDYAVKMGARVSNHSYGDHVFSQAHLDAITAAGRAGHLVVAAAGNGNLFGFPVNTDSNPFYPAGYKPAAPTPDNVIAVAATDSADKFASFSNYGATSVDLAAPGVNIYSTVPGGGYGYKSGTSMAAPHVAGAAALVWSADPSLTLSEVRGRILGGTDPIAALNPSRPTVTNGRLNVHNSLKPDLAWVGGLTLPAEVAADGTVTVGRTYRVSGSPTRAPATLAYYRSANATFGDADDVLLGAESIPASAPGQYAGSSPAFAPGEPGTYQVFAVLDTGAAVAEFAEANNRSGPAPLTVTGRPKLSVSDATVTERDAGQVTATFTVTLSSAGTETVTVDWATGAGSATAGSDYVAGSGTLTFTPDGPRAQDVTVQVIGDTDPEADETFTLGLGNAVNADLLDAGGTGTIVDNDGPGTLQFSAATYSGAEGGPVTVTVTRTGGARGPVSVNYATADGTAAAGADYTPGSGTLTFVDGETEKTVVVATAADGLDEGDETVGLTLTDATDGAVLGAATATLIIADDDPEPTVSVGDANPVAEGDSGATAVTFMVTLSAPSGRPVAVNWAAAGGTATLGTDLTGSGSVTFAPGETAKAVTVNVLGDRTSESDETFVVNLSAATNATVSDGRGQGTILNDDPRPTISIGDFSGFEGRSGTTAVTFTVTLSNPSDQTVTVRYATANGTATTGGKDYYATSGTLTFAPGETTKTITVLVRGDAKGEGNETFFVDLSAPTNAAILDGRGVGTILNDD